jgi:sRNA-binding carbon storage regulator CsrA
MTVVSYIRGAIKLLFETVSNCILINGVKIKNKLMLSTIVGDIFSISNDTDKVDMSILRYHRGAISLAFDAPRSVSIDREEIYASKKSDGTYK